jgi:hypothetical protein
MFIKSVFKKIGRMLADFWGHWGKKSMAMKSRRFGE